MKIITKFTVATLVGGAASAVSATAPPDIFGAAVYLTSRNCNGVAAGDNCLGATNPNIRIVQSVRDGGAGVGASTSLSPTAGGYEKSTVSYGALDLPVIRAYAQAGADNRNNTNSYGYQSFVYTGAAATAFALTATLDFTSSGAPVAAATPMDVAAPEVAGEGFTYVSIGLLDPSAVTGLVTATDIINFGFSNACGDPGVIGRVDFRFASPAAGAGGGMLTLSTGCDGNPIMLTPGQEILAFLLQQTPTNRGGFVDATHTLTLGLGNDLSAAQKTALLDGLISARSAVPEPASWAMLITGFALAGTAMRRRRAVAA